MSARSLWRVGLLVALFTCLALAAPGWAGPYDVDDAPSPAVIFNPDITITVNTIPLCPYKQKLDGTWQAHLVGSDGNVYFGSSTHATDESGMFFRFNPQSKAITVLCNDISTACGENDQTQVPQGKLHSPIYEHNGWVYTATHLANYNEPSATNFTGSHALGWNMTTGAVRDLGIIFPHFTCYSAVSVDPINNYMYAVGTPWSSNYAAQGTHMVRFDLGSGARTDLGVISSSMQIANFAQFVDSQGNMWFNHSAAANSGSMYKVAPSGAIATYANALPLRRNLTTNTNTGGRWWWWGAKVDADRFVFTMQDCGGLWEFDASKARDGDLSDAFRQLNWIGRTGLGMALGGDTIYYAQSANVNWITNEKARDLHLRSVDLALGSTVVDWGRIIDQDGRTPYRLPAMSADANGHVYFTGDWRCTATDPANYHTLRRYNGETGEYTQIFRGEFFGYVTAPEPAAMSLLVLGAVTLLRRRRA